YSAAAACAGRDAGRANVVLGFEADARRDHGRAEAAARSLMAGRMGADELRRLTRVQRRQAAIERGVSVALRIADLGRLSARRGAPEVEELDRLCRLANVLAGEVAHGPAGDAGARA